MKRDGRIAMNNKYFFICLLVTLALALPAVVSAEGNISVTSSPEGAVIYLDDTTTGLSAPGIIESVPAGTHTVKLVLSGYETYSESVTVSDDTTATVSATLASLTSEVSFYSVPDEATVYVDGTMKGYTNNTFTLDYGSREIVLVLDNYENWTTTLTVDSSIQNLTAEMTTTEVNGSLYFTSSPSNAEVYIEDEYYGTTSLTVSDLEPGSYDVLIYRYGYTNWTDTVTVTAGEETDVEAELEELEGTTTTAVTTATTATTAATAVPTIADVAAVKTYEVSAVKTKSTVAVPTPWPESTTQASPVDLALILVSVGLGMFAVRRR
jgi:hypothetical protein